MSKFTIQDHDTAERAEQRQIDEMVRKEANRLRAKNCIWRQYRVKFGTTWPTVDSISAPAYVHYDMDGLNRIVDRDVLLAAIAGILARCHTEGGK